MPQRTDQRDPLNESNLPSLFRLADRRASHSKWIHFLLVGGDLVCLSLAAVAKVFGQALAPGFVSLFHIRVEEVALPGSSLAGKDLTDSIASLVLPALFLGLAALMYIFRLVQRFEQYWLARRALAEAVRELAWRYSMRAMAADLAASRLLTPDESREAFRVDFDKLKRQGDDLKLGSPQGKEITGLMTALRTEGEPQQRADYLRGRLEEAERWYASRADRYHFWMTFFQWARIVAYGLGGVLIFFNAFGSYGLSAMTTIAGAVGTWVVAKHYDDLSQSYGVIAGDLNLLLSTAPSVEPTSSSGGTQAANTWARFVDKVEILLKGERQDWLRESKV